MLTLIQKVQIQNTLPSIGLVTNAAFNKKTTKIDNKIPDTTRFIDTPEVNRLAGIYFNTKSKK